MTISTKPTHDEESAIDQAIGAPRPAADIATLERQAGLAAPYDTRSDERASQRRIYASSAASPQVVGWPSIAFIRNP